MSASSGRYRDVRVRAWRTAVTERSVVVSNALGLHARAAARFVRLAARYDAEIRVACGSRVMDGKSIVSVLLLAAARGATLTIRGDGPDERTAVDALAELVETGLGEASWSA